MTLLAGGLAAAAQRIIETSDPWEKTSLSRHTAAEWRALRSTGETPFIGTAKPPDRPGRPVEPELLHPHDMPRRRPGTQKGRTALLHAIAHIELNAVDLHWDIIARFHATPMPIGFHDDWVQAADDESKHFGLLSDRLTALGSHYGAMPAHAGMWQAATDTADDLPARLAVVPMVLEARGLDVTPDMIALFERVGDDETVAALNTIYAEEVAHVAYGSKWFHFICGRENRDPQPWFHALVRSYFHGDLKPPFNEEKRAEAGIPPDFYWPLVSRSEKTVAPPDAVS